MARFLVVHTHSIYIYCFGEAVPSSSDRWCGLHGVDGALPRAGRSAREVSPRRVDGDADGPGRAPALRTFGKERIPGRHVRSSPSRRPLLGTGEAAGLAGPGWLPASLTLRGCRPRLRRRLPEPLPNRHGLALDAASGVVAPEYARGDEVRRQTGGTGRSSLPEGDDVFAMSI